MELSEKLANYVIDTDYDDLPEEVVDFTKLCILDYFASAIAGSKTEPIQKIDELVREMGGESQASLITGGHSSVPQTALLNGASSHIVEQDDIHKGSIIHAATVVIPAALAVAEWKDLSGKELINAVVIGYEVCYRIGEAVSPSHYYYWHNTATCGTFGAAAAVAKLLKLNENQIINTLGSAGTQAAGLWEFIEDGAMSKQLHPGKAAMNGVISALLGKKDFTGAKKILEGDRGFFESMSENYKISKITDGLGEEYKILENSFKVHASCRHTHSAMDLMIDLANERDIDIKDIDRISVKTYQVAINITDNNKPVTQYQSKFSQQFCTALALLKGHGNLEIFNEDTLWDENIRELMKRVDVVTDQEIDAQYPSKWGAIVEVYMKSGEVIRKETDSPRGDPENAVSNNELRQKFMSLTKIWSEEDREILSERILDLEKQETARNLLGLSKISLD
ncbi:MmgE/PrpD family protein [Lentibacillus sp. CBA3610]|uniref:MmgE/PrpD family protein n=1 Tax=Lentibacillus sp. CBA3610 TaxID=2518176 RepID=UPI0015961B1A|nr:MmgE/PrpD family protein [Lentibacillus sp. CBA3610]QKY68311.1 MmgE/PrpD family protein [Lentibacillus sp. CBA3610]